MTEMMRPSLAISGRPLVRISATEIPVRSRRSTHLTRRERETLSWWQTCSGSVVRVRVRVRVKVRVRLGV